MLPTRHRQPGWCLGLCCCRSASPASCPWSPPLLGIFGPRPEKASRLALVVLLSTLFILPILNRSTDLSITLFITTGTLFGMIAGLTYARSRIFRLFLTCLSPGVVVFPLVFLFFFPVS